MIATERCFSVEGEFTRQVTGFDNFSSLYLLKELTAIAASLLLVNASKLIRTTFILDLLNTRILKLKILRYQLTLNFAQQRWP